MRDDYWRASIVDEDGVVDSLSNLLLEFSPPSDCWSPIEAKFSELDHGVYAQISAALRNRKAYVVAKQHNLDGELAQTAIIEKAHFVSGGSPQYGREYRTSYATVSALRAEITIKIASDAETVTWVQVPNSRWLAIHSGQFGTGDDGSLQPATVPEDLKVQFGIRHPTAVGEFRPTFEWRFSENTAVRKEGLVCHLPGVDISDSRVREAVYKQVDDFLLIHFLATNEEVACCGAACQTQSGITTYYRRDVVIPRPKKEDHESCRIDPARRMRFLAEAYEAFQDSEYCGAIRMCCYAMRKEGSITESRFLLLFSVFEMLIGKFRSLSESEFVLKEDWTAVRLALKDRIRELVPKSTDRSFMYANLSGVNRVPLAAAFTEFARRHDIDCSGIWPINTDDGEPSLITVRNKLVHGSESISNSPFFSALITATYHLEWTLEICVLALLGWNRVDTRLELNALRARYYLASAESLEQARLLFKGF